MARGRISKYYTHVEPNLGIIENWRRDGNTIEQIAIKLDISNSTFKKYMTMYDKLNTIMKKSKDELIAKLGNSLYKECMGYNYEEKTIEVEKNAYGEVVGRKIKTTTKYARPAINGLIFALCNLEPKRFKKADKEIGVNINHEKQKDFSNETIKKAYDVLYNNLDKKTEDAKKQIEILDNFDKPDKKEGNKK